MSLIERKGRDVSLQIYFKWKISFQNVFGLQMSHPSQNDYYENTCSPSEYLKTTEEKAVQLPLYK